MFAPAGVVGGRDKGRQRGQTRRESRGQGSPERIFLFIARHTLFATSSSSPFPSPFFFNAFATTHVPVPFLQRAIRPNCWRTRSRSLTSDSERKPPSHPHPLILFALLARVLARGGSSRTANGRPRVPTLAGERTRKASVTQRYSCCPFFKPLPRPFPPPWIPRHRLPLPRYLPLPVAISTPGVFSRPFSPVRTVAIFHAGWGLNRIVNVREVRAPARFCIASVSASVRENISRGYRSAG